MQPTSNVKTDIPRASSLGATARRPDAAALAFGGPPLPPLPASPPRTALGTPGGGGFDSENYLACDPEAFGAVFSGHDSEAELRLIFSKRQTDARAAEELRTHMSTLLPESKNPIEILLRSLVTNAFDSKAVRHFRFACMSPEFRFSNVRLANP
jgi:hypothetical protein